MSDEFFDVVDESGDKTPVNKDVVAQFKEVDQVIFNKLIDKHKDVEIDQVIKAFKQSLSEMEQEIPIASIRETILISQSDVKIRALKETQPFSLFVTGMSFKEFKKSFNAKVYGFILEEQEGKKKAKRAPVVIIRNSQKFDEVWNFIKDCVHYNTYNIFLSVQGKREIDFGRTYLEPNLYWGNDITEFNDITRKGDILTASKVFGDKKAYNLEMKTMIENPSAPAQSCGLSAKQKGKTFTNDNDFKLLLVTPTSEAKPTKQRVGYTFSATSLGDPSETLTVFTFENVAFTEFNKKNEVLALIGAISKSQDSAYSNYTMDLIAMQRLDYSQLASFVSK